MAVLCWPWKGAQADLALRAYVASDAITPCKGRWKTCLRGAGGSHLSPPPHTARHGRLGPAVLPCPSARDAHRGEEDGARSTSPSSGNAAASLPALPISSSISWGAESQLAAHSQPQPREGFSLQPSQSCHDPYGLAAARGSSLRDASGQRRARGWWRCFQPAPGYRGARGTTASARGARPTPAGKTCRGGSAESTVLCVAMGTECRYANCFSFLSFFLFPPLFFFFYLPDIVIHIMFQLLGLAAEVREALCLAMHSVPREAPGPGGCPLEGCTQQRDPFPGHPPAATDKSNSHYARKVITLSPT